MSFITENKDIHDFLTLVSKNTGERNRERWIENLRCNRALFRKTGWAADKLQGVEKGKSAIIIGASPAVEKQIKTLKEIQYDKDFVFCALSSNLDYLLKNGIKPKYTIVVDAHESTGADWKNVDMNKTKDITLISNTFTYPPMLERWKGPLYFLALDSDNKFMSKKHDKWYGPANGFGNGFPSIMAQFNIMSMVAFLIFECIVLLFIGHELSFKDDDARYYVDRKDDRDNETRYPHGDINLNKVHTTTGLLAVKYSLEAFLEPLMGAGWFFNCTEAGIFGMSKKFPYPHQIPWIQQLTLRNGIAQARNIMRTGQPFYE